MRARHSHRFARDSRRGAALVLFVVLVFAFFAIAGVAIDVGIASLTQQQMQVAVDPAAMEGIRLRDFNEYQFSSDVRRRPKVSILVRQVFDDDLHPTLGIPAYGTTAAVPPDDPDRLQLGAGPMLRIAGQVAGDGPGAIPTGGVIEIESSSPTIPTNRVWDDPILQENTLPGGAVGNFTHGDMVSGTFDANSPANEDDHYVRTDFRPGPQNGSEKWEALGFLVRMRRTSGANTLDASPGKASHGPTLSFLWALGSLMHKDPTETWNPRTDGLTVRATAIAVGRPALRASPPPATTAGTAILGESDNPSAMLGLHSLALSLDYWTTVSPGDSFASNPIQFTIGSGGTLVLDGEVRGYIVRANSVTSVGRPITADVGAPMPTASSPGYVAIYARVPSGPTGTERVIGYIFADANRPSVGGIVRIRPGIIAAGSGSTTSVRIWVAANGASAQIGYDTPQLSAPEWEAVFQLNGQLAFGGINNAPLFEPNSDYTKIRPGTLLAPALAR